MAKRTGVTIIVVHHLVTASANCGRGKVAGSQALEDAPRWLYRIDKDPMAPEFKVLHLEKANNGAAEDICYRIIPDGHASRIEWVDRSQVERETRAWRNRDKATIVVLDGNSIPARRLANVWLKQTGGGTAEECAQATGRLPEVAAEALEGLAAEGIVGTGRRLAWRRG